MPSRHRSRERALQVLFQADLRQQPVEEVIASYYGAALTAEDVEPPCEPDPFMEQLVRGTMAGMAALDQKIAGHSEHWRLERMPIVDRNILRMAVHEMSAMSTPAPVVIDEALELARRYSSDESVAFINGVLDAVRRAEPAT
jgi:transcription antitermination protein NusB